MESYYGVKLMYSIGALVLDISIIGVIIWIVNRYLNIFWEKRERSVGRKVTWFCFAISQIFIEFGVHQATIWNTIISVILVCLVALIGYQRGKNKVLIVIILYAIWALVEMLVFYILNNLSNSKYETGELGSVISKILMIIIVNIISAYWKKKGNNLLPPKYYMLLLFTPLGSIFIALNEFYSNNHGQGAVNSLVIFSILLLLNISMFEIYSQITEYLTCEKERTVYIQQSDIIARNTDEQKKLIEEFQEEKHNLVNELIVIKNNIENDDFENVVLNLDKIIHTVDNIRLISNSGNTTVDAVINSKYAVAVNVGIEFQTKIFIPGSMPINQCDIGVVLGNAIDNAIEAARACSINKKIIEIFMEVKKGALILIIKNPFEHDIIKDNKGRLLSTKRDYKLHGYGVSSIKKVVQKYYGEVLIETLNGKFILTAIMNMAEI